ncbi:MAG: arginine--tRNA ligase [Acidimicrobiales bacterium]
MADPSQTLVPLLQDAMAAALGEEFRSADPVIRRSAQDKFGDYQANAAMALAKTTGRPPREVAEAVVGRLRGEGVVAKAEVAGPGFINLTLEDAFLGRQAQAAAAEPCRFVLDYGGANVAKELLVHHMRSPVIGDAMARVLGHLGHVVIRQDHLGDWGRQFGMLIEHLVDLGWEAGSAGQRTISDLNVLYQEAQTKFDGGGVFAERARRRVVQLQAGEAETVALWQALVDESERHFQAVYRRLGLTIGPDDIRAESFYNPMLEPMARELEEKGLARMDQGALCVFPEGFTGRDGQPLPVIIRNSEGAYLYAATDVAAVRYSTEDLKGERLVYFTDARQSQHFAMVFAVCREAGWLGPDSTAEHAPFGNVVGEDGRPFRTRSGDSIKLADLLDEAVARARAVVEEKSPDLGPEEQTAVAEAVGVGGLKYHDLANDRVKDYVFDWDRMLAREGNTAPYLQYAHARIRSILRRAEAGASEASGPGVAGAGGAGETSTPAEPPAVLVAEPQERALVLALLGFEVAVESVAEGMSPHRLCTYLFDLASTFTSFYEACPVLRAEPAVRDSRLVLCRLTASILSTGLGLLGIEAPERM